MIRDVKLIDYLPSHVQGYHEIQSIMNAEEHELQLVEDASETIKDNMFVSHTDETGVERYERMLGLTPSKNDDLHDRQKKVLARYTNTVIHTYRGLIERMNIICGVGNYTLKPNFNEYKLDIHIHLPVKNLVDTVNSMLMDVVPANILCVCTIDYNTHDVLSSYPTYLLMQFSHQELYDKAIDYSSSAICDNIANYTAENLESVECEHILNFGMRKV